MFKKAGLCTALLALSLPIAANAELQPLHFAPLAAPLTIVNNTSMYSVLFLRTLNKCSSQFGGAGVSFPNQSYPIPDLMLNLGCSTAPENCVADVYINSTATCTGTPDATAVYSLTKGVISLSSPSGKVVLKNAAEVDLNP